MDEKTKVKIKYAFGGNGINTIMFWRKYNVAQLAAEYSISIQEAIDILEEMIEDRRK